MAFLNLAPDATAFDRLPGILSLFNISFGRNKKKSGLS